MSAGGDIFQAVSFRAKDILLGTNDSAGLLETVATEFYGIATILTTIFVLSVGYAMIRGKVNSDTIPSVFITVILISITYQLAFTSGASGFVEWVYNPIQVTSIKLTTAILAKTLNMGGISDSFTALDEGFLQITDAATLRVKNLDFWSTEFWITYPIFGFLMIAYGILYAFFLSTILMGLVAVHILMAPGGFILALAAFNFTRPIFFSWLRAVITFALIPPFAAIVIGFGLRFVQIGVGELATMPIEKGVLNSDIGFAFLIIIVTFVLMSKVPEFAAALTSAAPSSVGGLFAGAAAIGGGIMAASSKNNASIAGGGKGALNAYRGVQGWRNPVEGHGRVYSAYLNIKNKGETK